MKALKVWGIIFSVSILYYIGLVIWYYIKFGQFYWWGSKHVLAPLFDCELQIIPVLGAVLGGIVAGIMLFMKGRTLNSIHTPIIVAGCLGIIPGVWMGLGAGFGDSKCTVAYLVIFITAAITIVSGVYLSTKYSIKIRWPIAIIGSVTAIICFPLLGVPIILYVANFERNVNKRMLVWILALLILIGVFYGYFWVL